MRRNMENSQPPSSEQAAIAEAVVSQRQRTDHLFGQVAELKAALERMDHDASAARERSEAAASSKLDRLETLVQVLIEKTRIGTEAPTPARQSTPQPPLPQLERATGSLPTRKPLPLPNKFSGRMADYPAWRLEVSEKLALDADLLRGDREACYIVASCLDTNPTKTVAAFYTSMQATGDYSCERFLEYLDRTYGNSNKREDALASLRELRQGTTMKLTAFLPKFEQLLAEAGGASFPEHVKIDYLRSTLNKKLGRFLVSANLPQEDYNSWVKEVTRVASQMERLERSMELENRLADTSQRPHGRQDARTPVAPVPVSGTVGPDGDTEMGNVNKTAAKGPRGRGDAAARVQRRCWECDSLEHMFRDCPDKKARHAATRKVRPSSESDPSSQEDSEDTDTGKGLP